MLTVSAMPGVVAGKTTTCIRDADNWNRSNLCSVMSAAGEGSSGGRVRRQPGMASTNTLIQRSTIVSRHKRQGAAERGGTHHAADRRKMSLL